MKKLFEIGFLVALIVFVVFATGCRTTLTAVTDTKDPATQAVTSTTTTSYTASNLAQKSIAAGGAVTAVKVVTSADPETGSFMPTIILGFGTFFAFDLPAGVSAYFQDIQKSMFGSEVGSQTTLLIMGTGTNATHVEIANPELIINIPGVKVFSPTSDEASLLVSNGKTTATSKLKGAPGRMPLMPPLPTPPPLALPTPSDK